MATKKSPLTHEEILEVLRKEHIELFTERSGLPLNQAQRNLESRTHYVDDASLRSFGAKVHSVHILDDGLLLGMVESVQKSFNADEGRVYRPVFFDLFGNIVHRPDIDESFDNVKKASTDMWKQADLLDADAITLMGIEKKLDALDRELKEWKKFWEIFS